MKPIKVLEASVLSTTTLVIVDDAGDKKSYRLVLDYNAIAKAQDVIKRDLSKPEGWQNLSGADLSAIAWAALDRFHPDVKLETVRSWLQPAQRDDLFVMLFEQCYPGMLDKLVAISEEEARKKAGAKGEPAPNPQAEAQG